MKDQFQRQIRYLRVSVTDLCNYRCHYCMPPEGVDQKPCKDILTLEELYYVIHHFVELGVEKVRITGGEPLIRAGIEHFIRSLGHLKAIKDLAMTTNASLLKDKAKQLKRDGLKRVNISLDTLKADKFAQLTGGNLDDALAGFHAALDAGLGVKINTVLLRGINDDEVVDLMNLTKKYPIDVRFIEAMPIGATATYTRDHFMSLDEIIGQVDLKKLENDDPSSPAQHYILEGAYGRVGFIQPLSHHFCGDCNRLRLTANGMIKPCLHSNQFIDLKTPLREGKSILPGIEEALREKPERHHLDENQISELSMNNIGG